MSRTQKPVGLQQEIKEVGLMGLRELTSQRTPPPVTKVSRQWGP